MNPRFFLLIPLLFCLAAETGAVERLRVMALFPDKAMVEIDGDTRVLRKGERTPEGVVLISADAREAVIEVDGSRESYRLGDHIGASFSKPESKEVKIWRNSGGSFYTMGSINGRPVEMLVDTGASSVALSEREAKRLGIPYRLKGKKIRVGTASGVARGYAVTLERVQVGSILLHNVEGTVIEGNSPEQVLLGMSFLNQVEMENQGGMMVLRSKY